MAAGEGDARRLTEMRLPEIGLKKTGLDVILAIITVSCSAVVVLATQKDLAERMYDISLGVIVSVAPYYLLVRFPERQKRERLKRNFRRMYRSFREECTAIAVEVADGFCDFDTRSRLVTPKEFGEYFRQEVNTGQTRWDAFENNICQSHLNLIIQKIEAFREELLFVLSSVDISDEDAFLLMKRLDRGLVRAKTAQIGYDEIRPVATFLQEALAGWSPIEGYTNRDFISETIERI